MGIKINLLDCTLRDGSYINNSKFGTPVIKGVIKKLQDARINLIECGWLKNVPHEGGSAYYNVPADLKNYLQDRKDDITYLAMIDWDRYDTNMLPYCAHDTIDAVRVVFPRGKVHEGIKVAENIRKKGYSVFLQAANTLGYSDEDLAELAIAVNEFKPIALSVVDTFGAMYYEDIEHIVKFLDSRLDEGIELGFHSHNNQQLSFALTMQFIELLKNSKRNVIVDASLSGMGRGAGNATTELVANYLNCKQHGNYDMNSILDAIDMYIDPIREKYTWGYSTSYFIAGMYQCHVNNIAYLRKNHRTNARDMRNVIASLGVEERRHYDYDLLEQRYMENQNFQIDDEITKSELSNVLYGRKVLLIAPGKSILSEERKIKAFIEKDNPVVIGVNAICTKYNYDYLFFVNKIRYDYAKEAYKEVFYATNKILLSNISTNNKDKEYVVNFNNAIKRGWEHFDNAVICALHLMNRLGAKDVILAGFDGFKTMYNESYADECLPTLNPDNNWDKLNEEIKDMFNDIKLSTIDKMKISFLTESIFE